MTKLDEKIMPFKLEYEETIISFTTNGIRKERKGYHKILYKDSVYGFIGSNSAEDITMTAEALQFMLCDAYNFGRDNFLGDKDIENTHEF